MRIAVLTANFGSIDKVLPKPKQDIDCDIHFFNEKNSPYPFHTIDDRLRAKVFKILPHKLLPDYDIYIWMDGNIQVKSPSLVRYMVESLQGHDITIQNHPFRTTIYQEADFICAQIKEKNNLYLKRRYSPLSLQKEIKAIGEGLTGLYACGIFARVNSEKVNRAFEEWYFDNVFFSNFDQIPFINRIHKHGLDVNPIDFGNFYDNKFYKLNHHAQIK